MGAEELGEPLSSGLKIRGRLDVRQTMKHYEDLTGEDLRAAAVGAMTNRNRLRPEKRAE